MSYLHFTFYISTITYCSLFYKFMCCVLDCYRWSYFYFSKLLIVYNCSYSYYISLSTFLVLCLSNCTVSLNSSSLTLDLFISFINVSTESFSRDYFPECSFLLSIVDFKCLNASYNCSLCSYFYMMSCFIECSFSSF